MQKINGKRLLILGGSRISCEIVKKAKELGIYTIVTDWYPVEKSPAKQIADEYSMTSTTDIEAMERLVREKRIDGITTGFTDSVLPYYAQICERVNLPCYGTEKQFEVLTDKKTYKDLCIKNNVPVIDEYKLTYDDIQSGGLAEIKYPVLVKPSDGSGAKGVFICNNEKELKTNYQKALQYTKTNEIIIERFIQGEEATVFYLLNNGKIHLTGIGNRHIKDTQGNVIALPVAYTFPSKKISYYKKYIDPLVKEMFHSLGMKNGMVFMQCMIENEQWYIYDIGYRLTGTLEYKLLNELQNYNPLEMLIKFAITGNMTDGRIDNKINPLWNKYACNISILSKPGKISSINGIEKVKEIPGVIDVVLAHVEGEELPEKAKGTLSQITVRVFATAESKETLGQIFNKVNAAIEIKSDTGENLLLDGFNINEVREGYL